MSLTDNLIRWFSKAQRVVIVGVGNSIRRDDNIGVEIVNGLEGKVTKDVLIIKGETVPESFIEPIVEFKPTHILIIDAGLMKLSPGTAKLVETIEVPKTVISIHALPNQIFCECLAKMTDAKVATILVQPKDTSLGEGLTRELYLAREKLVNYLAKIIESVMR